MFIESKRVRLRPLDIEDTNAFYAWAGDRQVTRYSLSSFAYPQSKTDIYKWLSEINSGAKGVYFGICCGETRRLIGYAGITGISSLNRCGEYFILIGDKTYWGKGMATEVTRLVTHYGFTELGLHRIELTAFSDNSAAVRAYEKAGYIKEGVLREAGFRSGKFVDKITMAVLAQEWQVPECVQE